MIVRRFMNWARTASAAQRAEAAAALARVYLITDLEPAEREEADLALTGLLDDPSPLVRRALAEAFASAPDAPHHIVLGLADDQSDISSIVLGRSRFSPIPISSIAQRSAMRLPNPRLRCAPSFRRPLRRRLPKSAPARR